MLWLLLEVDKLPFLETGIIYFAEKKYLFYADCFPNFVSILYFI